MGSFRVAARRGLLVAAWGLALVAIAWLTLTPRPGTDVPSSLCLVCGPRGAADAVLNTLLFVPLGLLLARGARARMALVIAVGASLSGAIELAQLVIPGRDASLGDLVFNTAGATVGALTARLGAWHVSNRRAWPAPLAALIGACALALGSWLLTPAYPISDWFGQWDPDLGHFDHYGGEVLEALVGTESVAVGRIARRDEARAALAASRPVRLVFTVGPPPAELAPIFSIYDLQQREIFLLGADGEDGVLRFATRGAAVGFGAAPLRFPAVFAPVTPGVRADVALTASAPELGWGRGACLRLDDDDAVCDRFSAGSSWRLLAPARGATGRVAELIWLALLFAPAGLLAAYGTWRGAASAAFVAAGALAVLPAFAPVGPTHALEYAAALAVVVLPRLTLLPGWRHPRRGTG
ncbi:MAG: VanZ family protein [Gemmatimonadota bacterium]